MYVWLGAAFRAATHTHLIIFLSKVTSCFMSLLGGKIAVKVQPSRQAPEPKTEMKNLPPLSVLPQLSNRHHLSGLP